MNVSKITIANDGAYPIDPEGFRAWLARQLLDSKLSDAEAYGIVAYHPCITDQYDAKPNH